VRAEIAQWREFSVVDSRPVRLESIIGAALIIVKWVTKNLEIRVKTQLFVIGPDYRDLAGLV